VPRVAALVHHSGAGITAALRAWVPMELVPIAADQHFWAARRVALGVAPARIRSHRLTADAVAADVDAEAPTSPDGSADFRTAWIVDPDGNRIELVQWPAGHADGITAADFEG
jgi:hypothetical protein